MKKLLITGFDPFGGEKINPAWEAVKRLPDVVGDLALTRLMVPTVFGLAGEKVLEAAKALSPDYILCVGQAGGRSAVTPEVVGINLRVAGIPDNAGNQPRFEPCDKEGANAYFATLPVEKMVSAIREAGLPASLPFPSRRAPSSATTCSIPSSAPPRALLSARALSTSPISPSRPRISPPFRFRTS